MNKGFTIIEMLVVFVIASILLAIAVPAYQTFRANSRASDLTTALVAALHFAKSEAIRQNVMIQVCGANATQTACNNSNRWDNGWIVTGQNKDIRLVYTATMPNTLTITPNNLIQFQDNGFISIGSPTTVTITPTGCETGYVISIINNSINTTKIKCP